MMMTWCWIIPIIVGLITAILGYFLGHSVKQKEVNTWKEKFNQEESQRMEMQDTNRIIREKIEETKSRNTELVSDMEKLQDRFNLIQHQWDQNRTEIQNLKEEREKLSQLLDQFKTASLHENPSGSEVSESIPHLIFDSNAAQAVFGKPIKADDLTIVEGIGPKIQELFQQHGINTWYALSQCSIEQCQEILRSGGPQFAMHNPATWPQQALFCFQGKWKDLKKWQEELEGGV